MKKLALILFSIILCINNSMSQNSQASPQNNRGKKVLVAYFSRADENYGVGNIKKGNTQILAEMIAKEIKATTFHIETVKPYPVTYKECINVARKEKNESARPEIKGDVKIEDFDVIFIGMPNWWGELPMAVYSFVEKHNWEGKKIIPFATHEGSGMDGMDKRLENVCMGSTLLHGIAIKGTIAQLQPEEAKEKILSWLKTLKY